MRVLHLDTGRTRRGGQIQIDYLLQALPAHGIDSLLLSPLAQNKFSIPRFIAESRRASLVHCHDAGSHTLAALFAQCPIVVSRRVAFPVKTGLLSRLKYMRPALFLAVSHHVSCQLLRAGIPESKIQIVPDAVPLPTTLSDRSGPLVALDSDDPLKGRALIRSTGLAVHFTRSLESALPTASAFLYVTESEGLGSAALLAMAHGVPVIASRAGGLPEIVRHLSTGLLVRNHASEIQAAVARLRSDPTLAATLAANARSLVETNHSIRQMAHATANAYRSLTK